MRASWLILLSTLLLWPISLLRGGESAAVVRRVIGRASAAPSTALPAGAEFSTGARSKSELTLPQGVARLGEKATVETRAHGLTLRQGVTLVASQPGAFRQTVEVRAPGYRLRVKGTVQVAFDPGHSLKVVVLEGTVTIALDSLLGEFETLRPGQMLIIDPSDRRLPDPVEIDIQRLVSTSALLSGDFGPLATSGNIKSVAVDQTTAYERGDLQPTALVLRGLDNEVEIQQRTLAVSPAKTPPVNPATVEKNLFNFQDDLTNPGAITKSRNFLFPDDQTAEYTIANMVFERNARNPGRTHILFVDLQPRYTVDDSNPQNPIVTPVQAPELGGRVTVAPGFFASDPKSLVFDCTRIEPGFDQLQIESGANVFTPAGVGLSFLVVRGLNVDDARLTAGSASQPEEQLLVQTSGGDDLIQNGSVLKGDSITMHHLQNPGQIVIDHSRLTARENLALGIATSPTGITIRNSSQLASVAANLSILTSRASVVVDSSKLSARRRLTVDTYPLAMDGSGNPITDTATIDVRNATLMAESIRLRAFAPNGDALIIDGSVLNASQLIELYAEGASTLHFESNVTLKTALAILAGQTVEVDPGSLVSITGKGRIFADNDEFNKTGYGTIQAGKGLTTGSFASRPGFKP